MTSTPIEIPVLALPVEPSSQFADTQIILDQESPVVIPDAQPTEPAPIEFGEEQPVSPPFQISPGRASPRGSEVSNDEPPALVSSVVSSRQPSPTPSPTASPLQSPRSDISTDQDEAAGFEHELIMLIKQAQQTQAQQPRQQQLQAGESPRIKELKEAIKDKVKA